MKPALIAAALALVLAAIPGPARGQPPAPELEVDAGPGGVSLRYSGPGPGLAGLDAPAPTTVALLLPAEGDPAPQIVGLERAVWPGDPPSRGLPARSLPDGSSYAPLPAFDRPAPAAPVELLYEARMRGRRIGVYAVNPLYLEGGAAYLARSVEALVPGAIPLDNPAALAQFDPDAPFLAAAPGPDPLAARPGWSISVSAAGIQSLSAAALRAAGLDPATVDVSKLRLTRAGQEVALEEIRSGGALSELRFYAPPPGDRWGPIDLYRLTLESTAGLRVASRDARPQGGPASTTALARGAWYEPVSYESRLAGPDGDHFFSADLRVAPLPSTNPATTTLSIAPPLPRASGSVSLTVSGASLYEGAHTLRLTLGSTTRQASWSGGDVFSQTLSFPAGAASATLALLPGPDLDGVHIDRVTWELPVSLKFGGQGALFYGRPGRWAYQLSELPASATLYDVSDPARPRRLTTTASAAGLSFEDDSASPRAYLLAGPGTIQTPAIAAHIPTDLSKPLNAAALYIAPRAWLPALDPLLARRRAEGLKVAAVAAEAIYAGWSDGMPNPAAIRAFLRYAAASWTTKPTSVTLVGDGTSDPHNYFGTGWASYIPPYLLPVDPWIGETACESCFAQLDGDSPLDDLLPDLAIGRLPAKSADELSAVVGKILAYETDRTPGRWRGRVAYIADNPDDGGDFPGVAEASAARQPPDVQITRVYYDPEAPAGDPAREPDPLLALDRTLAAFGNGAGVLVYFGHGLQYQWALTGPPAPPDRRFLLGVDLARTPTNRPRLPVALSMTCLSGAFQTPGFRGTTLDEALVLNPDGGAIATWGSTGFGVLFGHEALTAGFFDALWQSQGQARLGSLTLAGYARLAGGGVDAESLRTFVLLGDPLTPLRMIPDASSVFELSLPLVRR